MPVCGLSLCCSPFLSCLAQCRRSTGTLGCPLAERAARWVTSGQAWTAGPASLRGPLVALPVSPVYLIAALWCPAPTRSCLLCVLGGQHRAHSTDSPPGKWLCGPVVCGCRTHFLLMAACWSVLRCVPGAGHRWAALLKVPKLVGGGLVHC